MNNLTESLKSKSTESLVDVVKALANDFSKEASLVFESALSIIEERVSPDYFQHLCQSL